MRIILILLTYLISLQLANACCSAFQKRIFPIGIKDNKIIAVQMELYRNCDDNFYQGDFSSFSFVWSGTLKLMQQEKDSLIELQIIDSLFRFTECECNIATRDSLSDYDSIVHLYYQKGLSEAKKLNGFEEIKLISIKQLEETDTLLIHWKQENELYFSKTKHTYNFKQDEKTYEPVYNLAQLKVYKHHRKRFYILNLDNNYYIPEDSIETKKNNKAKNQN